MRLTQIQTQIVHSPTILRSVVRLRLLVAASALALVLAGGLAVIRPPAAAQAQAFTWHAGYSVQAGWLCYGTSAALHCTQHWSLVAGRYVSGNPAWVPSQGSGGSSGGTQPLSYASRPAGGAVPWQGGSPNHYPRGSCTDGAARLAYFNVDGLGNARDWLARGRARGIPSGTVARLHAIVVFQPGVEGADRTYGHVAFVTAVHADGSFSIEEMNAVGWSPLGGFNRFSPRSGVRPGPGVAFLY